MIEFPEWFLQIVIWLFIIYAILILLIYAWIGIYAIGAVLKHKKINSFTDYSLILSNPNAPTFSLIAPAYNEGVTIVENVRSLLSLYYKKLEIIIINDGSKDDSILQLIKAYNLEEVSFFIQGNIKTKPIKAVYKSKNAAFKKLIVVDKENGGKADALNVGINIATGDTLVCIDVDCILEQDAIVKLAKPFLEQTDKKLIACGGVIRLANNCIIESGKVTQVNLPKTLLGRAQALEYIRAFVLGRMAWSRASGLILISGAFGAFDRKTVVACGGYDVHTVGEDMELVVRMRRYMEESKQPYKVVNIPDSLCWTEAPESKDVLKKQRNRWMRGTMETLWKHRKLLFNPKYGKLGMVSLPYWLLFEFLAPLIEFFGYILFVAYLILGIIKLPFFLIITAIIVALCTLFSVYAIFTDLVSYRVYTKQKDFLNLIRTALIEPFYYHILVTKACVSGFFDYFKKEHSWGSMTRQGFNQNIEKISIKEKLFLQFYTVLQFWSITSAVFLLLFIFSSVLEWKWYQFNFTELQNLSFFYPLLINNLFFAVIFVFVMFFGYTILQLLWNKTAKKIVVICYTITLLTHYLLFVYFSETRNILGADVFYYDFNEAIHILKTSGMLSFSSLIVVCVISSFLILPLFFSSKIKFKNTYSYITVSIMLLLVFIGTFIGKNLLNTTYNNEFLNNTIQSKLAYFFEENEKQFLNDRFNYNEMDDFLEASNTSEYPFLKEDNTPDFIGSYFNKSISPPNLVFIVIEGLGYEYSSPNGYFGNFTPFIDSLSKQSLYWPNCISSSGRTFAALPTLTASLPFAKNGILEMDPIPEHFNLFNVLKHNGYKTGFFYGGNAEFDGMKKFLEYSNVDNIIDEKSFENSYKKLPKGEGDSWGFEDQAVFTKFIQHQKTNTQPYFNLILTLSTHSPFLINNQDYYVAKYQKLIEGNYLTALQKKWAKQSRQQLITVLNADDALKNFFSEYSKDANFKNTIFVITGDHAMPEIPLINKIDRYHVPLIIYSSLLKESMQFNKTVSHFDLAPSIMAYYNKNYALKTPSKVTWVGNGLNASKFREYSGYPIMKSKDKLADFVYNQYYISDDNLFIINKKMEEQLIQDQNKRELVFKHFIKFKKDNNTFKNSKKIMPDSLKNYFFDNISKH